MPAQNYVDTVLIGSTYYAFIVALASLAMLVNLVGIVLLLYHWNSRLIGLTQPLFTLVVLVGGILLSILCFLLVGNNTTGLCGVRPFLFNLAFTMSVAPLLIKSVIVHEAAKSNFSQLARGMLMSAGKLMSVIGGLMLVDLLILLILLYGVGGQDGKGTRPVTVIELTNNGAYSEITRCAYGTNNALVAGESIFKGCLIAVSCMFAFLNRYIANAIASSRELLILACCVGMTAIIVMVIHFQVGNIAASILVQVLGICLCVILNAVLLVGPSIYMI